MTIQEILNTTEHRPWKMPSESWKFYQEWNNTIFLHYQVNVSELEKFLPKGLEIDLYDGKPWLSVVAFTMEKIRPKNLPSFSPISNFEEINIRTYVRSNNKTEVYFLSIEGGKGLSCKVAKFLSELPYKYSKIKRTENSYRARNSEFDDRLDIEFEVGKKLNKKTKLDKWLTERYALFQDSNQAINKFEIHHLEWPINELDINKLELSYPRFEKLINVKPNVVHYSEGVQVIAWGKKKLGSK